MKLLRRPYPSIKSVDMKDLQNTYIDVGKVINGGIDFGSPANGPSNINGDWFVGTTPGAPNTEFTVPLKAARTGFITLSIDAAGILYRSTTTWTATTAYLKCNIASAHVTIFLT